MSNKRHFALIGIPLSRPEIVDFLVPPRADPRGRRVLIVGQRPSPASEAKWITHLTNTAAPTIKDLLLIDDPQGHLVEMHTDRLVPVEFLAEPDFLTRRLGGWVANYFGVLGYEPPLANDDPLLKHAAVLLDYKGRIRFFGADPHQAANRLSEETGLTVPEAAESFCYLHTIRREHLDKSNSGRTSTLSATMAYADRLYAEIVEGRRFANDKQPPLPVTFLIDELIGQMVHLEVSRRTAVANQDRQTSDAISAWQETRQQASGLKLLLKGEYIVGRHRRSTILIAPELGLVIKQPAPEPFHEIELGARLVDGQPENWPVPTEDGSLVTARGRLRLILEEDLVPRISRAFGYNTQFSLLLGLTLEMFVQGDTVLEAAWGDENMLTSHLYEEIVLHQLVCEELGIENGDWHAANFILHVPDQKIVHIDWGAARPLRPEEQSQILREQRLHQVRNIAYSFKHDGLVKRIQQLHEELVGDDARMASLRKRAKELSES